ncbi:MAG: CHASE2 domain-containing protein [Microcystaceae cyanobacterium]
MNFLNRNTLKRFLWNSRGVWITTPAIALLVYGIRLTSILQPWEWAMYDAYMQLRPSQPQDERIIIVGITEEDLENLRGSVIKDDKLAKLLNKLKEQQPVAIGLDIYRNLAVPPGTEQLNEVFNNTPNLVGIQKVVGEAGKETVNPPPILAKKGQVGANDLIFDGDNRIRRGLIYVDDSEGNIVYSLSIYLALHYLQSKEITPEVIEGTDNWKLGKTTLIPLETNDGSYVRTDAGGFQVLINYRGGNNHFRQVSVMDVLNDQVKNEQGELDPEWGKDKVILIGNVEESANDYFFTPYRGGFLKIPVPTSGVEIHANLTSQAIAAALDDRALMRTYSELGEFMFILLFSAVGSVLSWQFRYTEGKQSRSLWRWGGSMVAVGTLFLITYYEFIIGWWLPVIPALLAFGGAAIAITAYIARTAGEIRKTFGRYLTDQVVENLLENPSGKDLGGVRKEITILTSDLRGFTATSERFPPEEVIKILNFYLGYMADVITKYEGTIDEFLGDGILVLFGAPTKRPDDAQRAIACAVEMQQVMKDVNQQMKIWKLPQLEMGIGINTGEVVVGNIGSEKRTKYGVVGSQVNLTYRIESYTTGGQILISESTLNKAWGQVIVNSTREVQPKGIPQPITIYDVGGIKGKFDLVLEKEVDIYVSLSEPIALQYQLLKGKDVDEILYYGRLVELSEKGGKIAFNSDLIPQEKPPSLTNLKINFLTPHQTPSVSEDIYGKIIDKNSEEGTFYIYFTAKPPRIAQLLEQSYQMLLSVS